VSEFEMEVGRKFGATAFFIYQALKCNPNSSIKDLEIETGMHEKIIRAHLKNMELTGLLTKEQKFLRYCRGYVYKIKEEGETYATH
jgi:DNA-binding MarR family transcriptional regulator